MQSVVAPSLTNRFKIIVGGFSQGGALALHVAMRSVHPLAACIAFSTWLPLRAEYPAAASTHANTLPMLQVHGDADMVVGYKWGMESHKLLKTMVTSPEPQFHTIERMGHGSDEEEIAIVNNFVKNILGDTA